MLFLGLTLLHNFAFELLTGDLTADQAGDGVDRCVGAGRIVLAYFLSRRGRNSLVTDPVPFNCHSLHNSMPGKGRRHGSVECQVDEGLATFRAVNRMTWRRKGMGHSESERG